MYKIFTAPKCSRQTYYDLKEFLIVMKLTVFLILLTIFQVRGASFAQEVSLKVSQRSLKGILSELTRQTGYNFICDASIIRSMAPVSINVNKTELKRVLELCFTNTPVEIIFDTDKTIIIRKKQASGATKAALIEIRGKVIDETGLAVIGATVAEKGGTSRTNTNVNGDFKLKVNESTSAIVISAIGFVTQEVSIAGKTVINVKLKIAQNKLEEVVVVGYGEQRKRDITGAISKVDIASLQKAPVLSFDQALAGRVTGVQVVSQDGQPGSPVNIVIRGNNSLTQDNSPLYVIDGFPIENPDNNMINPNEIESIEILKDASASAIYGARGANGVILITTKKGKIGAPTVEYRTYYASQSVRKRVELMNPYEYVKYLYELNPVNTLQTYLHNVENTPEKVDSVLNTYKGVKGLDLQDEVFGGSAPFANHNISVRGGTKTTLYSLSGNYADQKGLIVNSGIKRYQLKFNLEQAINSSLKVGFNSTYTQTNQYGISPVASGNSGLTGGTSYLMASVWGFRPVNFNGDVESLLSNPNDVDIDPTNSSYIFNPIYSLENEYHKNLNQNLIANGFLDYKINSKFKLRISAGLNQTNQRLENFYNTQTIKGRVSPINTLGVNGDFKTVEVSNLTNENILTYTNTINKIHRITVLAGVTAQKTKNNSFYQAVTNLPNESLKLAGFNQGIPGFPVVVPTENSLMSGLTRLQYDYKSKYLLTASYRADGSSKFSKENRWSYFPSGSFAWRLSSEPFMKPLEFLSDAKLRLGYGITGNNRVPDFVTYSTMGNTFIPVGGQWIYANTLGTLGNKDLKWETTKQSNAGLDLDLFRSKIALTVDYYYKTTSNLLLNAELPRSSGYSTAFKNIGKVRNKGLEISLNTRNINKKNFQWTSNFNISFNRNKVLELAENQEYQFANVSWNNNYNNTPLYIAKKGEPMGKMYGFINDGLYQYSDFDVSPTGVYTLKSEVASSFPSRNSSPLPGTMKYKDLNGDGVITNQDRAVIGNANPVHTGGFINNITYRNFDLSVFFEWSYGNEIYNANRLIFENGSPNNPSSYLNMFATYANRWSPTNQTNDLPRANAGVLPGYYYYSKLVEDGSYLRLKTFSLGYTLSPKTFKQLTSICKELRVYASAQNLLTFSKYSGFDPEVNGRPTALTPGFDYSVYPRARTLTLGVNVSF